MVDGSADDPVLKPLADGAAQPGLWRRTIRLLRRLGPTIPLALAAAVLPGAGALVLYGRLGVVAAWLREHPVAGPFVCAGAFGVAGGCALAPTYALSALCGWSFGFEVGFAAALGGFLAAALLAHALASRMDRGRVMHVVNESPNWRAIHCAFLRGSLLKATLIVALVRLAPVAPFSLTNMVMAATRVPLRAYAAGTVLGMAPRTAFIVFTASRLEALEPAPADEPLVIAAALLTTLFVCMILSIIGKRALAHVTRSRPAA